MKKIKKVVKKAVKKVAKKAVKKAVKKVAKRAANSSQAFTFKHSKKDSERNPFFVLILARFSFRLKFKPLKKYF